ncbi:MAG: threonine--tRNA ligase [Mycoplasma sp.]|nr:threonine--tRNA ligase [Mycoplasma sp.]
MKFNKDLNHSASHVMAMAVLKLWPDTKLGFGPPTKEGFYYDFKFNEPLLESDLRKIEKQMQKIVSNNYVIKKMDSDFKYDYSQQPYKKELYDEFKSEGRDITYFSIHDLKSNKDFFVDLCAGGHIHNLKDIKHFKILSLAGSYWRGDSNNDQLTRIYATAWETKEELDEYLNLLQERKERDHRKIGKEMNLFMFDQLSGQGFPIWLEDGMKIRNRIMKEILAMDYKYNFLEVSTPIVGEQELYETSGHWKHYKDDMFKPIICDNEKLVLRPMTCPHHVLIYRSKRRSYRELPIKLSEQSPLFRYEKSGALTGLERVRAMLLTEAHLFVRKDQIFTEFTNCYNMISETLKMFNVKIDYVSLSLRDPNNKDKFFDDDEMWKQAEDDLRSVLDKLNVKYQEKIGEAAFYGPKIDIQIKTVLGHEITMSTLQLDFLLPRKFNLEYINSENQPECPIMIHRGLIGTYERFVSILLEQTKGNLPFWLAPKQIVIIPVNDNHIEFSEKLFNDLKANNFYVEIDDRNERMSKKIREAQISKTKIQIVIGDEEISTNTLSLRFYGESEVIKVESKNLIDYLLKLTDEKK